MHRRPKLTEAIEVLQNLAHTNDDALQAIVDYNSLLAQGETFIASRMVVDIVDHYYHLLDIKGIAHG